MNKDTLLNHLKNNTRALRSAAIERAFRAVDRADFVPEDLKDEAYENYPLPIGFGVTISQPTTVAFMLEKLDVRPGQKVLDVGSGSGWTTALLTHLVGPKGRVIGLEIIPELVALGQKNLTGFHSGVLENLGMKDGVAEIRQAKKDVVGFPKEAPFDRILVSAAAEKVPQELIDQLKTDGVLVIPVGAPDEAQKILNIHKKSDGTLEIEEYPGFVFVPLVEK